MDTHSNRDSDRNGQCDAYIDGNHDSDRNAQCDAYIDGNRDSNGNTDIHSHAHTAHSHSYEDAYADQHSGAHADPATGNFRQRLVRGGR